MKYHIDSLFVLTLLLMTLGVKSQFSYPTKNPCKDTQTPNGVSSATSSSSSPNCQDCSDVIRNCRKCYPSNDEENKKLQEQGGCIECYTMFFRPPTKDEAAKDALNWLMSNPNSFNSTSVDLKKTGPISKCRLNTVGWLSWVVGIVGVIACICCCCFCANKDNRHRKRHMMYGMNKGPNSMMMGPHNQFGNNMMGPNNQFGNNMMGPPPMGNPNPMMMGGPMGPMNPMTNQNISPMGTPRGMMQPPMSPMGGGRMNGNSFY